MGHCSYIWRKSGLLQTEQRKEWLFEISTRTNYLRVDFREIWRYRDLLLLFVRRDIVSFYKQTILGPLWYLIQPILTTAVFTIIFNTIGGIGVGPYPPFLFNLVSVTCWTFFSTCLTTTSDVFKTNAALFGKVYFPRVIMPLSIVVSNLVKFGIQLFILLLFYLYFRYIGWEVLPDRSFLFFPLLIICMGLLGLGIGMIVSSMVTKYRDLSFLITFGVQLLMFISAVNYPIGLARTRMPEYAWLVEYNPMAHMIELARHMILGAGEMDVTSVIYLVFVTLAILAIGIVVFNKTERSFIDTI